MTPYAGFLYFGVLLYLAVPIVSLGLAGVRPRRFLFASTAVMLVLQFGLVPPATNGSALGAIGRVAGFGLAQWAIAAAFLAVRTRGKHRLVFYGAIAAALVPLVLVKAVHGAPASLVAFAGISYASFRALDVLFGIQDGLVKDLPGVEYLTYLLFFPSISAGPIDRYRRFRGDYRQERSRAAFLADLDAATEHIFRGLLYTFVIAVLLQRYWVDSVGAEAGVSATIGYMYGYSLHLFFDFAGYSAFAIGVGYVLGVRMPENFNRPFLALNIVDFWNRWHITLSSWLRDHVYGRFVLAATRGHWFTDRYRASYLGSLLAFGLMGLWHGSARQYLVYGLYHGLLIVGYGILTRPDRPRRMRLPKALAWLITVHAVCFGFLIFSGRLF